MATVIFYEKPGCINNTKQKALLEAVGHTVKARNLLTEHWIVETLRPFFGNLPVGNLEKKILLIKSWLRQIT